MLTGVSLTLLLGACAPSDVSLSVDIVTDWQPFLDFTAVHTELWSTPPGEGGTSSGVLFAEYEVDGDEPFISGHRVAELDGLVPGPRWVRVTLRDPEERAVARRTLALELSSDFAATLLLARACSGIECAPPQECQGGACVDPECSPTSTEFCPEGCATDADCASVLPDCEGQPVCVSTACLCDTTPDAEVTCDDGVDEDRDGATDCADPDCAMAAQCASEGNCSNGLDDDGDGQTDCDDADCSAAGACVGGETDCTNDRDDDGDGQADCADSDCIGASCDDGMLCTHTDRCTGGACTGTLITCADEECVTRSCNGTSRCTETNRLGAFCTDDANPCTIDQCISGVCRHNAYPDHIVCPGQTDRRSLCCRGQCVDTRSDPRNCGACGFECIHFCDYDANVDAGACACPGGDTDCIFGSGPNCYFVCFCADDGDCPGSGRCVDPPGDPRPHCVY